MLPVRKTLTQCAENATRESVIRWYQDTFYQLVTTAMSMISLQYWILWSERTVFRETDCGCYRECPSDPVCSEEFHGGVCNTTWPGPGYQTTHTGYMCKIMEWGLFISPLFTLIWYEVIFIFYYLARLFSPATKLAIAGKRSLTEIVRKITLAIKRWKEFATKESQRRTTSPQIITVPSKATFLPDLTWPHIFPLQGWEL